MPWTWNTFLAISKPIVVICMWTAPYVVCSNDHLTAIRRRERAPSTTSKPEKDFCNKICQQRRNAPQQTLPAQLFSSRLSSLKKRQSVPWVMILVGVDLIIPDSCNRSE